MVVKNKGLEPRTREWDELLETDFPDIKFTKETVKSAMKNSARYRGSVRFSLGLFWTDDEYEKYRKKVLNTPLP